jgi:PAS domain S-box-containing protein
MNERRPDIIRILAVDDDQHVLDLYQEFLSSETSTYSFELTVCHRGDEAVEAVRTSIENEKPFALAFIDVRLDSGPDGVWAAEQIRTLDPNTEIVVVTAYGDFSPEEIVTRVPPARKLLYISKPLTPEEIRQIAVALSAKWHQEVQLHEIRAELEAHVEKRTSDLRKANEQLKREIEERLSAQEEIGKGEERYCAVVEDIPAMICRFLPDGTLTFVNNAYRSYFNKKSEELLGQNFFQFIPEQEEKTVRNHFLSLTQEKPMVTYDHQVITPDGANRWQRWTDRALFDEQGHVVEYQSIGSDITEQKQAVDELLESEERYRTVLEANPDPVVVYDIEGKVIYFNPAFTRVFGWSLEERLGKKIDSFVPEENWSETRMMIKRVLAGESFSGVETRRYTKDGNIIPVSISGAIYRDGSGNPVGSVINLRDISEQKKLEAQLQQAQKMEAVGTLAGGIAHDFNNLLQAIQGYTELLLMRKKKGERGLRELQEVVRAAKRGGELTQQLLTFSRKVESERRPLDLNQEVEDLRELLKRTIPKMIEVKLQLSDDLQVINGDSVQLNQVLMNMVVNAKDAMVDGGTLLIQTKNATLDQQFSRKYAEVKPGDYVQLTISDTGHGMNKETLEHIFDPFYTTKDVGKGTGLGLAIVYGIIKNHEGYITCYSRPRTGTTFKIYLPSLRGEKEFIDMVDTKGSEVSVKGGNETILLVDDEEFIRELGTDVLGRAGYQVLTAADGEIGLELYRQKPGRIDLVILDLIMPGMGGSKCLEELLKIDPKAKVLIASGYSPDGPTKGELETGAKGFVSKPYDTGRLLELVRKILDK